MLFGPLSVVSVAVLALSVVCVLHAAAVGLGRLVPLPDSMRRSIGAQHAVGLGLLLFVMQVAGSIGLIGTGPVSVGVIWGLVAIGLGLLATDPRVRRCPARTRRPRARIATSGPLWFVVSSCVAIAAAVALVAAASPPGWLWRSEYGGFDALSYHLPIAQEWLALGRVAPLEHVVYSALPSGMEVSFAWLAPLTISGQDGLLAGDGWRLMLTQVWHASFLVPLAWGVREGVRAHGTRHRGAASLVAAAIAVLTPWAVVTGTLAYNDLAAAAFMAAAFGMASRAGGGRAIARGAVMLGIALGVLTGAAALCKPTALLIAGPAVAVVAASGLLRKGGAATLAVFVGAGSAAGLVMLSPWLVRNWLEAGNPLFPFATDLFGAWHWSAEQASRWDAGHTESRGLVDRLGLLVLPDSAAGPNAATVARLRGATNPQWGVLWLAAVVSLGWLAIVRTCAAVLLGAGLVLGLAAWAVTTHIQSRFLIPLIGPLAVTVGVALASGSWERLGAVPRTIFELVGIIVAPVSEWESGVARARVLKAIGVIVAVVLLLVQWGMLVATFYRAGSPTADTGPNGALFGGVPLMRGEFGMTDDGEAVSPVAFVRSRLLPGDRVYLLGDAKPLYFAPGGEPLGPASIAWHTVWDAGGIDAIAARAAAADWIVVDYAELDRYAASGYADIGVRAEPVRALVEGLARPRAAFAGGRIVVYQRLR